MATSSEIISDIKHWWLFLLRGILFILLGIYMISAPLVTFVALSMLFGIVIVLGGAAELVHAYANRYVVGWSWRFLLGLIDVALGFILIFDVKLSITVLPLAVGLWFLFRGFSLFSFASVMRRSGWMMLAGVIIVLFALLVMFNPAFGAMTIVLWAASAFIVTGIINTILAFRLKAVNEVLTKR
ncbi:HdeD family acid-resistance protein [Mucilaginibacter sp. X5P1]|uniref:HdeD family acid-resistance protein n=1 Tax=Mucilaginibacter sp. X5P1 TaxID=2723088 RepID=UPI00161444D9|nr:DUF308 domain-containing protein [Mucilaginibacter sp. X5P1]MBB6140771.1 uncharacterized membrane protein HdeD (DUF308 family) [Mucilaginibacter sp. X5P1]